MVLEEVVFINSQEVVAGAACGGPDAACGGAGDAVALCGAWMYTRTVTVLFELSVTVLAGSLIVAVLFIVIVVVAGALSRPGVKPGTTPGVLVKTGGGAASAAGAAESGAALVELQPSDIGASVMVLIGTDTVDVIAAAGIV